MQTPGFVYRKVGVYKERSRQKVTVGQFCVSVCIWIIYMESSQDQRRGPPDLQPDERIEETTRAASPAMSHGSY